MEGYCKVKKGANYAGVSVRTFRNWLKNGLKHSRMGSNSVLIKYEHIDDYIKQFEFKCNEIDDVVNSVMADMR